MHISRFLGIFRSILVLSIIMLFFGCGGGGSGGNSNLNSENTSSIATGVTSDGKSVVAEDKDGNALVNHLDSKSVTLINSNKTDNIVLYYGDNNLPAKIFVGGYIILYNNWTTNSVDLAIITPNNAYIIKREVPVDPAIILSAKNTNLNSSLLPGSAVITVEEISVVLKASSIMLSAGLCGSSVSSAIMSGGLTTGLVLWSCSSTLMTAIEAITNNSDWEQAKTAWNVIKALNCSSADGLSCIAALSSLAAQELDAAHATELNNSDTINVAQDALTLGANQSPLVASITSPTGDITITKGASVNFSGSVSGGSGPYQFSWNYGGGATNSAIQNPGQITFSTVGNYVVTLTVSDNLGLTSSSTISVKVNPVSGAAPIANAGLDQEVEYGALVTIDGSGSTDSDGTITSYSWTQISGPTVNLLNNTLSKAQFTAEQIPGGSQLSFQLKVTDSSGLTSTDTCTITVGAHLFIPKLGYWWSGPGPVYSTTEEVCNAKFDLSNAPVPYTISSFYFLHSSGAAAVSLLEEEITFNSSMNFHIVHSDSYGVTMMIDGTFLDENTCEGYVMFRNTQTSSYDYTIWNWRAYWQSY